MILYPAIDLKNGQCVRLLRGDMNAATTFSHTPDVQAQQFADQGFSWIHVVDLNGAFAGKPVNAQAISAIVSAVDVPVQLGGGIRSMAHIEHWLKAGIARVIIGTQAVKQPQLVVEACKHFPGQIAVGIDAIGGMVAVQGWGEVSSMHAIDVALRFGDAGVCAIIYTDINRDGAMQGPNIAETVALAERISTPVILSGGISTIDDLIALKSFADRGISGAIIGRAMYEGAIDPAAALKAVA